MSLKDFLKQIAVEFERQTAPDIKNMPDDLVEYLSNPSSDNVYALTEPVLFDYVYLIVDTEAKAIQAALREMRLRMLKPIGTVRDLNRLFLSYISLLFGLCSSSTTLIISAFYGNSLSRIPSLQAA